MNVKTDTKERFTVITLPGPALSASMTGELSRFLHAFLQNEVKNLVVDLSELETMDIPAAEKLVYTQQHFYENNASFVLCGMNKALEDFLDQNELLELMNVTPTVSEAGDIVQMEEMEREMGF